MHRPLERLSVWPYLETESPSTAGAPAVNPVHPAATPSCATHTHTHNRKHRQMSDLHQYTHTQTPSLLSWYSWANNTQTYRAQTHALRPNTRFKTLCNCRKQANPPRAPGRRFTHQLHHLISFNWEQGRRECEYVWRLRMCEWAVCE